MDTVEAKPWKYPKKRSWGFWNRFVIGHPGDPYIDRISLVTTPWFSVKLHRIYRPDGQAELHDHPWTFLSIVLLGSYVEDTVQGLKRCRWWNFKWGKDRHSIRELSRRPVWTLLFCGRSRKTWGFWVDGGTRWIKWTEYEKLYEA